MDRIVLVRLDRAAFVDGVSRDVEDAAHHPFADRHRNRSARVGHRGAALEALGPGHGDRANPAVPEVLLDFERELDRLPLDGVVDGQRVVRSVAAHRETPRRPPDPRLERLYRHSCSFLLSAYQPAWPPAISSNSLVMLPCRSLLYSSVKASIRLSALSVAFFIDTMRALCSLAFALRST